MLDRASGSSRYIRGVCEDGNKGEMGEREVGGGGGKGRLERELGQGEVRRGEGERVMEGSMT